jgi:integrase
MSSVKKVATGYRAQIYVKGQRDSQVFRTKREADAWASARETELRSNAARAPKERHTLKDAIERYRDEVVETKRGARWETIRFNKFLDDTILRAERRIGEITPEDIGEWRNARLQEVSAATVLRELTLLSAMFECARREWRWVPSNPVKDVAKPARNAHRERLITWREIRAMLFSLGYKRGQCRSVSQAVAMAFLLALRTGMRAGEIAVSLPHPKTKVATGLRWSQVREGYLANVGTKTDSRDVPLSPKAARIIEAMRGFDPEFVFGITGRSLDALFRRHRERAGMSGFTFHDSRHTAATWLAQRLHVLDLCRMFGWASSTRALVYYNPKASDIAARLR